MHRSIRSIRNLFGIYIWNLNKRTFVNLEYSHLRSRHANKYKIVFLVGIPRTCHVPVWVIEQKKMGIVEEYDVDVCMFAHRYWNEIYIQYKEECVKRDAIKLCLKISYDNFRVSVMYMNYDLWLLRFMWIQTPVWKTNGEIQQQLDKFRIKYTYKCELYIWIN